MAVTLQGFKNFAHIAQPASPGQKVQNVYRAVDWFELTDSLLQSNLDLAKKNVLTKLGNPAQLPDEPGVDRSVYLFAQYYTENWTTQEQRISFGSQKDAVSKVKTEYYRARVFEAINREVDNLIRPLVDVSKFMPEVV